MKNVTHLNRAQIDIALGSVCVDATRDLGSQSQQRLDRSARLAAGLEFQYPAEENEHGNGSRRSK